MTSPALASSFHHVINANEDRADRRIVDISAGLRVGLSEIAAGLARSGDDVTRRVRVSNTSDTGLRLDGWLDECWDVEPRDIVALRLGADGPLTLGTVVRVVPDAGPGRIVIGVRRFPQSTGRLVLAMAALVCALTEAA